MDVPLTALLGPMGALIRQIYGRPMDVNSEIQQLVDQDLMKGLVTTLKDLAEADDTSFMAKWWMKEVRELCYDTEDHLDEVMIDISEIMARVKDASKRRETFHLASQTTGIEKAGAIAPFRVRADTGGRTWCRRMDDLVELMAFDDDSQKQLKVVSIFGLAGVGKTTAVKKMYHQFGRNFDCRAFLRVSRNPDIRRLLTSILSQIKAPEIHGFPDVQFLTASIREHLQNKRFIIVVDDLWSTSAWDIINRAFPDGYCSRIITTTQVKDVSLASCSYHLTYRYEMSPLNADQSADLFFTKAFGSQDGCPADIKYDSYEIIRKCGGLPLAIVSVASLLSACSIPDQWEHIQYSLLSTLKTNSTSEGMKEIFNLTYNNLSPHLKTCFLYLSMYPEGYTIRKSELVQQWIAESFIRASEDTEHIASGYFDELVSRGLIQPVDTNYNDEVLSCTVHHLLLDFIRYKSMEENFIISVDNLPAIPGLSDKVRRLSIQFGGSKTAEIPESMITSQARSLLFCGFLKLLPSIVNHQFLRVLILCVWADHDKMSFDLTGINELFLLRYIKIEGNITVELPSKIRDLNHLATLEVDARMSTVPSDIDRVHSLLHLRIPSDNVLDLDNPTNLQELHLTCFSGPPHRVVRNMKHLCTILSKCESLQSLVLEDSSASTMSILCDGLSSVSRAPARLQRLELLPRVFIFHSVPKWLKHLSSLCILKIAVRELPQEDMDILKRLPGLAALSLYVGITPAQRIVFDEGFTVLKYFKFTCTALCLAFSDGVMPKVHRLKLRFNINTLEKYDPVHAGLQHLSGLREISAKLGCMGTDESDKKSILMEVFSNHSSRPIFNVQLVDHIIQGHRHKLGDLRCGIPIRQK
ncbi:disease resistance protein RGA5-like [Lolium rigidum]|uniref:disease resistance protein RGA5-like n=1 Tax=Lolium rigidum TaxID=89674 RepID=UPI001F5E29CF|nr:disease resistance protein RGA5-like [Lolium rigidum]